MTDTPQPPDELAEAVKRLDDLRAGALDTPGPQLVEQFAPTRAKPIRCRMPCGIFELTCFWQSCDAAPCFWSVWHELDEKTGKPPKPTPQKELDV